MLRARSMRAGILAVASLLTLSQSAYAQADRGTITGQVTDQSAAIISGASVKAVHVATNFERTVTTSKEGSYTIPQLPVGGYVVIVTAANFQTTTLENIEVTAGGTVRVDAQLAIGGVKDAVTVTSDARQIQTDDVKVTTAISSKFIQDLPLVVGGQLRSPLDLSLIAPEAKAGTSGDGSRGNIVIGGGQEGGWDLSVDGVSATPSAPFEQRLWTTLNSPSVEAITEFAVDSNGFKAEFGHAGGGAVSFVSRSGSNRWQGKAFEFFRHDSLDSINYFSKALGRPKPPIEQHDFGGVFGGPVMLPWLYNGRNRTFFFSSYEGYRNKTCRRSRHRHDSDGGDVCRRLLPVARRQRQSHSDLRPCDHTRQSERARVHPRSVSRQHRIPLDRFSHDLPQRPAAGDHAARSAGCPQQLRLHVWRHDQHQSLEQVQPQTRSQPLGQGSPRIPVPLGRGARPASERWALRWPAGPAEQLPGRGLAYLRVPGELGQGDQPDAPQPRDVRPQQLVAAARVVQS